MKIELVKETDAQELLDIALAAFADDKAKYGDLPPAIDTLEWHHPNKFGGDYYKVTISDKIIGGFRIIDKGNDHYYFASAFIAPQYQNKGYGHKIMSFIEERYPQVKKWSLDTPYKSYRNHYFYGKHGFKKVNEFKPNPNREFILFYYEKLV